MGLRSMFGFLFFFRTEDVTKYLLAADFEIEEIIERGPYGPEVEYQSRRAYVFARKKC